MEGLEGYFLLQSWVTEERVGGLREKKARTGRIAGKGKREKKKKNQERKKKDGLLSSCRHCWR